MKPPREMISSQKGLTIVEVLVALGILFIAVFSFMGGFVALSNLTKKTSVTSAYDKQINEICENIKAGVENYQINFNFKDNPDEDILPVESLPMAWDVGIVAPKGECSWCQGAFGYTIRPTESMRGLYTVQIRFTHKSWGASTREFSFIVSVK